MLSGILRGPVAFLGAREQTKTFLTLAGKNCRIRWWFRRRGRRITKFALTLECLVNDKWCMVARIDNEGGTVHKDTYHVDGTRRTHRQRFRASADLNSAMKDARDHLLERADWYEEQFKNGW